ncbi:MAG: hypothetical protein INR69_07050 [Mucilaginibacter polytrichastri]|nr:hypothetical protein [Mucilaginibacter polytrichastri]
MILIDPVNSIDSSPIIPLFGDNSEELDELKSAFLQICQGWFYPIVWPDYYVKLHSIINNSQAGEQGIDYILRLKEFRKLKRSFVNLLGRKHEREIMLNLQAQDDRSAKFYRSYFVLRLRERPSFLIDRFHTDPVAFKQQLKELIAHKSSAISSGSEVIILYQMIVSDAIDALDTRTFGPDIDPVWINDPEYRTLLNALIGIRAQLLHRGR